MKTLEIMMRDRYHGLGSGRRRVEVLSIGPKWLRCKDMTGQAHRVPRRMFLVVEGSGDKR